MTPFDLSVIVFFIAITAKVLTDAFEFWREQDEAAEAAAAASRSRRVRPAVRHLPAPCRPSPAGIAPRSAATANIVCKRRLTDVCITSDRKRVAGRREVPAAHRRPAARREAAARAA